MVVSAGSGAAPAPHAIELRGLSFHFDDGSQALADVSLHVAQGERVALVGPNGAGKSTLMLHLVGLLPEAGRGHGDGDVLLFGERLRRETLHAARRQVGLLFQDPDDQLFCPTVGEDIAFGPQQLGMRGESLRAVVADALAKVGLAGLEARAPHRLSGGEKKRVALAGVLACSPRVLAFDEPTSGLDPRSRRQLVDLLEGLSATCVIATHDLALAAETCARTVVLDGGRLVAQGPTRALLRDDALMKAHGLGTPRLELPSRLLEDGDPRARSA
jgi:cobalt/nickel transport system ATP-binding protein